MNRHLTAGCKTVILINGVPASGKSTITQALSQTFGLPLLTIDEIKEPFMACFTDIDRPFNRQLGMRGLRGYLVDHRPFTSQRYLVSRRLVRFPAPGNATTMAASGGS
ncbi:Uncharacterised protein [Raoultella ornithinolytica]|nr:Uncharacterised protein [Raoultella ornithinolytica]